MPIAAEQSKLCTALVVVVAFAAIARVWWFFWLALIGGCIVFALALRNANRHKNKTGRRDLGAPLEVDLEARAHDPYRSQSGAIPDNLHINGFEGALRGQQQQRKTYRILGDLDEAESQANEPGCLISSARTEDSASSIRSSASQQVIADLQNKVRKLQEERDNTRSTSKHEIEELQIKVQTLTEEKQKLSDTPRSTRSDSSQRIIGDLQGQLQQLKEDKTNQTPRSARSETSQCVIDDLHAQIQKMREEKEKEKTQTPRSARSDTSQRLIDDLQAQVQKMKGERATATPRSARSETSQRIIEELQGQIQKLKEIQTQTPRSGISDASQCVIAELQAQIQKLKEENANQAAGPLSARSDSSQKLIEELQAQIERFKFNLTQTPRSARSITSGRSSVRSDTSQRIINDLQARVRKMEADSSAQSNPSAEVGETIGRLVALMESLQLPPEYNKTLSDEGIEFLEDLEDYDEAELVQLGFKKAHAKRLLKAVAAKTAPADDTFSSLVGKTAVQE